MQDATLDTRIWKQTGEGVEGGGGGGGGGGAGGGGGGGAVGGGGGGGWGVRGWVRGR